MPLLNWQYLLYRDQADLTVTVYMCVFVAIANYCKIFNLVEAEQGSEERAALSVRHLTELVVVVVALPFRWRPGLV